MGIKINYCILLCIFVYFCIVITTVCEPIKTCPSFRDYDKPSKKCTTFKDYNITEIIEHWPGFTAEEYYLTTEDGYRILVERSYSKITQKYPIVIAHGIGMNALGWVHRGNVSLARLLGELGYDVWMVNYRGTWYSKGHINMTTSDKNYWKFTIDHLASYDIRSTLQLVNKHTNRKVIFIGYSMGTSSFFMFSSTYPNEAEKYVKSMIGLAPVINYKGARSFTRFLLPVWPMVKGLVYTLWNGEVLPGFSILLRPFLRSSAGMYSFQALNNLIFGDDFDQMDPLTYPLCGTQLLDTAGVELFSHFYQILETGDFKKFDHGKQENLKIYGTSVPPKYDLSKIPVPMSLFVGENDWLATITNAKDIYAGIQPSLRCGLQVISYKKWSHLDFLTAKDLPKYLYKPLFKKIKELSEGECRQ